MEIFVDIFYERENIDRNGTEWFDIEIFLRQHTINGTLQLLPGLLNWLFIDTGYQAFVCTIHHHYILGFPCLFPLVL